jgi:putative redox protein
MTSQQGDLGAAQSQGTVVVTGAGLATYTQFIAASGHHLTADEPRPVSDDTGPTPYDLLLAALGACTSMTVQMYAKRKAWALQNVRVTLHHSRIHAQDWADRETTTGRIDHIDLAIELTGDLDDAQLERLLYIAGRCPVHQTLISEIDITISLEKTRAPEI